MPDTYGSEEVTGVVNTLNGYPLGIVITTRTCEIGGVQYQSNLAATPLNGGQPLRTDQKSVLPIPDREQRKNPNAGRAFAQRAGERARPAL